MGELNKTVLDIYTVDKVSRYVIKDGELVTTTNKMDTSTLRDIYMVLIGKDVDVCFDLMYHSVNDKHTFKLNLSGTNSKCLMAGKHIYSTDTEDVSDTVEFKVNLNQVGWGSYGNIRVYTRELRETLITIYPSLKDIDNIVKDN